MFCLCPGTTHAVYEEIKDEITQFLNYIDYLKPKVWVSSKLLTFLQSKNNYISAIEERYKGPRNNISIPAISKTYRREKFISIE